MCVGYWGEHRTYLVDWVLLISVDVAVGLGLALGGQYLGAVLGSSTWEPVLGSSTWEQYLGASTWEQYLGAVLGSSTWEQYLGAVLGSQWVSLQDLLADNTHTP